MKLKTYLIILLSLGLVLMLSACSDDSDEEADEEIEETNQTDEESSDEEEEKEETNESSNAESDEENEEETVQAVAPSEVEDTINFTRIWWTFGAPDRKPNAGVWLYTEDDHPSNKTDVFNFDEHDILLYQIGNEEYLGYQFRAQRIVLEEDDIVRVILRVHEEPSENSDPDRLEMPRQYLEVEKGVLRGKAFIFETEDGEILSVQ